MTAKILQSKHVEATCDRRARTLGVTALVPEVYSATEVCNSRLLSTN